MTAWMPVLGYPLAIPISMLSPQQAISNHGQTLERIAERGGLSLSEAAALASGRAWRSMSLEAALAELKSVADRRGRHWDPKS